MIAFTERILLDDDNDDDGDDDKEFDADKELGKVEQSEEDKLDPDLWDKKDDEKEDKDIADGENGLF